MSRSQRALVSEVTSIGLLCLLLTACAAPAAAPGGAPTPQPTTPGVSSPRTPTPTPEAPVESIVGKVLHFTAPDGAIEMTIDEDNVAVRDLLTMLPLTLTFEDFAGLEKIAYPPREITVAGAPPSAGGAGDVAIYTPWGNIAFFYAGTRGEPSTAIAHLGTFDATAEELAVLESGEVTVTIAE